MPHSHLELSGPHYFHSTVAQAYLAGATRRIPVNSCVTLLAAAASHPWPRPWRPPIGCAAGASWSRSGWGDEAEFNALGVPFHERGRMADEYLAAILELWTSDAPSFDGKYVSFDSVAFEPKPVQPHPPIWIGGDAVPALKRAARFASGWIPFLTQPEEFPAKIDFIKSQPTYDGRPFEVCYGLGTTLIGEGHVVIDDATQQPGMTAPEIIDRLCWFAELCVTMSSVPILPVKDVNAYLDYAEWVIEEIKPKVPEKSVLARHDGAAI
jgi:hypothetical protein